MPRIGLVLMLLLAAIPSFAAACPFCGPTPPTLAEQLADADVGMFAEWVKVIEPTDELSEAMTQFRVVEVLRATDKAPDKGAIVTAAFRWDGKPGDPVFLLGTRFDGVTEWKPPIDVNEITAAYIRQTPSPEKPAAERLPFFLRVLEAPEPLLANDAFAEFSRAKYEDVVAIKDKLPRDKLRKWLADPNTTVNRIAFYGLLLGLCGTPDDAEFLASRVFPSTPADGHSLGVDGLMAGYVLLTGEAGFQRLVERKLNDPTVPDGDVIAVVNLLRFLWQFAPDRVPREKVAAALRPLVDRPQFAEIAIIDLARWKDWSALPTAIARFGREPFDTPLTQQKVIQYALACVKHGGNDPMVAPAQQFLDRLLTEDPDLLQQARRSFSSATPLK